MVIRDEQMRQFEMAAEMGFQRRATSLMQELWPDRCAALSPPELQARVSGGIESARSYGILEERQVCRFLSIRFMFNRAFPDPRTEAWAEAILRDQTTDSVDRMNAVWAGINSRYRQRGR